MYDSVCRVGFYEKRGSRFWEPLSWIDLLEEDQTLGRCSVSSTDSEESAGMSVSATS